MAKKDNKNNEKIVPLSGNITPGRALEIIRQFIDEDKVEWHGHCLEQMKDRGITDMQVLNCLLKGVVKEAPFSSFKHGGCVEVAVTKVTAGEKIKVVVGLQFTQQMLVITAMQNKFGRFAPVKRERKNEKENEKDD